MVEVFACVGKCESGQIKKILADGFKMIFIEKMLRRKFEKIILLLDKETKESFSAARSW